VPGRREIREAKKMKNENEVIGKWNDGMAWREDRKIAGGCQIAATSYRP
jgi:hypothetical protein